MKKIIVGCPSQIASKNLLDALGDTHETLLCDSSLVELTELKNVKNKLAIVASSHSSKAGVLSLSAHAPGNFGPNQLGGEERKLSIAPSLYIGEAIRKFNEIKREKNLPHEVTLEVTHHGPSFNLPIIFVELGSNEIGWNDPRGIDAATKVINHLIDCEPSGTSSIGFGGPHYAPNFTKRTLEGENFGHICPKYASEYVTRETVFEMIEKTFPSPEKIFIDWKGLPSGKKQEILLWAEETGKIIQKFR